MHKSIGSIGFDTPTQNPFSMQQNITKPLTRTIVKTPYKTQARINDDIILVEEAKTAMEAMVLVDPSTTGMDPRDLNKNQ